MGYIESKYREVSNPADFRKQYLSGEGHTFCDTRHDAAAEGRAFLETAPLEQLKALHSQASFEGIRRNFYTMVLLTAGSARETIGYSSYRFSAGMLYFIPASQLHTIHSWSADIKGYHCIFDADYFLLCLKNQVRLNNFPFLQPGNAPFIQLSGAELNNMEDLFRRLQAARCSSNSKNDDLLVRLYLNVLLIEAEKIYHARQHKAQVSLPRKEQLAAAFKKLVSLHFIQLKQVSAYAKLLHVNPHYLNDTIKELTGKPASSFIYEQVITEAKAQLIQTSDTVSEIAFHLNFSDQSYFCRFFKKHTGLTPFQFRMQHQHGS